MPSSVSSPSPIILIVDDSDPGRYATSQVLRRAGLTVWEAATGQEGLQRAADSPEIILVDVHLPDISGHEVCRRLKADPATAGIPVLQMSACFLSPEDRVQGLEGGADDYLTKPMHSAELLARVRVWLRVKQSADCFGRLHALTAALSKAATTQEVATAIIAESLSALGANSGAVALLNAERAEFHLLYAEGLSPEVIDEWKVFPADAPVPLAETVRRRMPVVLTSREERCTRYPAIADVRVAAGEGAVFAVPMEVQGRMVGGLIWNFPTDRTFSDEDIAFALTVAGQCGQALERARLFDAVVDEVTERKNAEQTVRRSEEHLRLALDAARMVAWVWNPQTDGVRCSANAASVVGLPPGTRLETGEEFFALVHPDDRPDLQARLQTALRGKSDYVAEFRLVRPDTGAVQWMEDRGRVALDEQGNVVRITGVSLDITRRKESEQVLRESERLLELKVLERTAQLRHAQEAVQDNERRFRAIIEKSYDAFSIMAPDGTITYASPSVERIGGRPPEDVVGRSAFEWSHPDDVAPVAEQFQQFLQRPGESVTVRHRYRHKDGSWRWIEATSTNFLDEPSVQGIVCNFHDVTEQMHLEEQYRQAQKLEAVGRLAGGIAHDFNNLLTVIQCCSELLLDGGEPETLRSLATEIQKAGERAAGLTQQLLAFSRKQVLQQTVFDLNGLVADLKRMLARVLGEDIGILTSFDPQRCRIKADATQMEQVVLNLAVNARDAMPSGGSLILGTRNVTLDGGFTEDHSEIRPGPYVLLSVSDSGCGMDEATLARIFEPFFTTKEVGKGTGLGLATVYGIVKQSGGHLRVQSKVGQGTTFEVYLPAIEEPTGTGERLGDAGELSCGTETVLLVEDEEAVRVLTKRLLQQLGYNVLGAANGLQAVDIVVQHPGRIDLLLTDVVMPGMGGGPLSQLLRNARPDLKVLYMSGHADEAVERHGVFEADVPLLQKPFTKATLARTLRDVLGTGGLPSG